MLSKHREKAGWIAAAAITFLQTRWTKAGGQFSGTSPIMANGIVFHAHGILIMARDHVTGNPLWSSNQIGGIHWQTPLSPMAFCTARIRMAI